MRLSHFIVARRGCTRTLTPMQADFFSLYKQHAPDNSSICLFATTVFYLSRSLIQLNGNLIKNGRVDKRHHPVSPPL